MASNKADGTKCLKKMIRYHGVDIKCRKSIRKLVVGSCSSAFLMLYGELSHGEKIMSTKSSFLLS
jgi:hypothetical protein